MKTWIIVLIVAVVIIAIVFFVSKPKSETTIIREQSGGTKDDGSPLDNLGSYLNGLGSILDFVKDQKDKNKDNEGNPTTERKLDFNLTTGSAIARPIMPIETYTAYGVEYRCNGIVSRNGVCSGSWIPAGLIMPQPNVYSVGSPCNRGGKQGSIQQSGNHGDFFCCTLPECRQTATN